MENKELEVQQPTKRELKKMWISPSWVQRGQLAGIGLGYILLYDIFGFLDDGLPTVEDLFSTEFYMKVSMLIVIGIIGYAIEWQEERQSLPYWPKHMAGIVRTGIATYRNPEGDRVPGQLFLNAERLEHHPNLDAAARAPKVYVLLKDIDALRVKGILLPPRSLLTLHTEGEVLTFVVANGKRWKREIERLRERKKNGS